MVLLDIKPDNILVQSFVVPPGLRIITQVALGDFDIVTNLEGNPFFQNETSVGTVEWQSPESQTGRLSKSSDIFAFGLVVSN